MKINYQDMMVYIWSYVHFKLVITSFKSDLCIFIEYCFRMRQAIERLTQRVEDLEKGLRSLKKRFKDSRPGVAAQQGSDHQSSQEVHYNGYSKEDLKRTIVGQDRLGKAVKLLLSKLFEDEYLASHSISGKAGNRHLAAKPMMDPARLGVLRELVCEKFGSEASTTAVNEKNQQLH